jgi:hypothetical protein
MLAVGRSVFSKLSKGLGLLFRELLRWTPSDLTRSFKFFMLLDWCRLVCRANVCDEPNGVMVATRERGAKRDTGAGETSA